MNFLSYVHEMQHSSQRDYSNPNLSVCMATSFIRFIAFSPLCIARLELSAQDIAVTQPEAWKLLICWSINVSKIIKSFHLVSSNEYLCNGSNLIGFAVLSTCISQTTFRRIVWIIATSLSYPHAIKILESWLHFIHLMAPVQWYPNNTDDKEYLFLLSSKVNSFAQISSPFIPQNNIIDFVSKPNVSVQARL